MAQVQKKYKMGIRKAIPIPITTIGMRLPRDRIVGKRVAASKPQALGMVENDRFPVKRI